MKSKPFVRAIALALFVGAVVPAPGAAFATPVAEMRAEDLLPLAAEVKKMLALSVNQQTLWQQVENKSRAILRERQARRERLQAALRQRLDAPNVELRELAPSVEAEASASAAEENTLRELWLGVNDALDENQRQKVAQVLAEQLTRVPADGPKAGAPRARDEGGRGMGRGRGHGAGGAGGAGGPGGQGGQGGQGQ
ncbi:MAG: hypothetical protein V4582_10500 [Pseudomonadota bacterium]